MKVTIDMTLAEYRDGRGIQAQAALEAGTHELLPGLWRVATASAQVDGERCRYAIHLLPCDDVALARERTIRFVQVTPDTTLGG